MHRCIDPRDHHYQGNKSGPKAPQKSLCLIQPQGTFYPYSLFMKMPQPWNNATLL